MVREAVGGLPGVTVEPLDCLLVDFCRRHQINVVIRGLRAYSDFEYEFQMALTNRKLAPDIETLFLMPNEDFSYVSSSMVREIASLGGEAEKFVPAAVAEALRRRLGPR